MKTGSDIQGLRFSSAHRAFPKNWPAPMPRHDKVDVIEWTNTVPAGGGWRSLRVHFVHTFWCPMEIIYPVWLNLRSGDESQPRARIFLFPQRNAVATRSVNHLQHIWKTSPCFATLRPPFRSITSHPLANYLVPNPNGRCSPLSPQTSSYNPVWTRLETQTICNTFGRLLLALQPFAPTSSISLLIPLQTILFRTPTDAALRWASEFLHFPPFSLCL